MNTENIIIPLCLYSNNYITYPEKIYENGVFKYVCSSKMEKLTTVFYAINPDVKPNPTHTDLIGIKNRDQKTTEIINVYDPFNNDENISITFLAWLETTPNTIRLYITTDGENIHISLYNDQPKNYVPYKIPFINVLSGYIKFSNSYRKCIPDPNGDLSIDDCLVLYNKNIISPNYIGKYPDILTYLRVTYNHKNKKSNFKIICGIILCVFILVLFWIKMKKINIRKKS